MIIVIFVAAMVAIISLSAQFAVSKSYPIRSQIANGDDIDALRDSGVI